MTIQRTNEEVKAAVIDALSRLHRDGKNITGGVFTNHNGNVQLTANNHSGDTLSVYYNFYSTQYSWIIPKVEVYGEMPNMLWARDEISTALAE